MGMGGNGIGQYYPLSDFNSVGSASSIGFYGSMTGGHGGSHGAGMSNRIMPGISSGVIHSNSAMGGGAQVDGYEDTSGFNKIAQGLFVGGRGSNMRSGSGVGGVLGAGQMGVGGLVKGAGSQGVMGLSGGADGGLESESVVSPSSAATSLLQMALNTINDKGIKINGYLGGVSSSSSSSSAEKTVGSLTGGVRPEDQKFRTVIGMDEERKMGLVSSSGGYSGSELKTGGVGMGMLVTSGTNKVLYEDQARPTAAKSSVQSPSSSVKSAMSVSPGMSGTSAAASASASASASTGGQTSGIPTPSTVATLVSSSLSSQHHQSRQQHSSVSVADDWSDIFQYNKLVSNYAMSGEKGLSGGVGGGGLVSEVGVPSSGHLLNAASIFDSKIRKDLGISTGGENGQGKI